jgi:hypothetical protein
MTTGPITFRRRVREAADPDWLPAIGPTSGQTEVLPTGELTLATRTCRSSFFRSGHSPQQPTRRKRPFDTPKSLWLPERQV